MDMKEQAIKYISEAMEDDSLVIFVGAGASANSGLPTWNQLIKPFRKDLQIGEEEDNLKVAQFYYDTWGQQKYFQKISDIFKQYINASPNDIHEQIFKIQPRHIITTNYDTLLEDKMNSVIEEYDVIRRDEDIPYSNHFRYLIKMHGDLTEKNIVLKEDDYTDYENNFYMISTLIKSLIMNCTLLFIGYSLNDSTFNSIFRLIHKSLGDDAKKAYFYTPSTPSEAVVEYYKRKGIVVLSEKSNVEKEKLGTFTSRFLKEIADQRKPEIIDEAGLWEEIKFLDKLAFVESVDVSIFSKLQKRAYLYFSDRFAWGEEESNTFKVGNKDENLLLFIQDKTWLNHFIGKDFQHEQEPEINNTLKPAFDLYEENKYGEARVKFREIANDAFERKDYINFLLAEFNVNCIQPSIFDRWSELPEKVYSEDLNDTLTRIIDTATKDDKKIAIYFRDTIQNFEFVYRKLAKIDKLLNGIKEERINYRRGGMSSNSHLSIVRYEFNSFMQYIRSNCLCIFQYREFQSVINNYFECLLVALANSNHKVEKENIFNSTSSVISEIGLSDIKNVVPYLDKKLLDVYLDTYSLTKIPVSVEGTEFILTQLTKLSENLDPRNQEVERVFNQYLNFLVLVQIDSGDSLIDTFKNMPLFFNNREQIRKMLIIIDRNVACFSKEATPKLEKIIMDNLEIITNKKLEAHYVNFSLYQSILKQIGTDTLSFPLFYDQLILIQNSNKKLPRIVELGDFIVAFYIFLEEETKKLITEILRQYSKMPFDKIDNLFVIRMILINAYDFLELKDNIFTQLVNTINGSNDKGVKKYPDPVDRAVLNMFELVRGDYFTLNKVREAQLDRKVVGRFPEVDWSFFDIKDEITAGKLIMEYGFLYGKKLFCTDDYEKKIFDNWAIQQFEEKKVKLIE